MKKILLVLFAAAVSNTFAQRFELVKNIQPELGAHSYPYQLTQLKGDVIIFGATDTSAGTELFISNGTASGTSLLKDINPGADNSDPNSFYRVSDTKMLFSAVVDSIGRELFVTNGTSEGTLLVKDINPGANGSVPNGFISYKNKVYFAADNGSEGVELWVTDGTEAGTELFFDLNAGAAHSYPSDFFIYNNLLFFVATVDSVGKEIFVTDGTVAGTRLLKDINPSGSTDIGEFVIFNNKLFFSAYEPSTGYELWVTDGTEQGTNIYIDLIPGVISSTPYALKVINGKLVFVADYPVYGLELWATDGNPENTIMLKDIYPSGDSYPWSFVELHGKLYFTATNNHSRTLYVTDGTILGTKMVLNNTNDPYFDIQQMVGFKNRLYFGNYDANENYVINFSTGALGNTQEVFNNAANINDYGLNFYEGNTCVTANYLYISGDFSSLGDELYKITHMDEISIFEPAEEQEAMVVFPNPAVDMINVVFDAEEGAANISIVDVSGRTVKQMEQHLTTGQNHLYLNISDLNSGVYFLKVNNYATQKIIKK